MDWPWGRGGENKRSEKIAALEEAVERLESRQRLIKVEWEAVLDKVNSVMGRLNARIRKSQATSEPESPPDDETGAGVLPPTLGSHATLSEMRRRRGVLSG